MLAYNLLPSHSGLRLLGHLSDFDALRIVLHDVAERSPLIGNKDETPLLGLANALRKAYDRDPDAAESGGTQEAEIDWLSLLATARVLRGSLAFIDHGKRHQAMTYALEAVIHDGLTEDFGEASRTVLNAWHRLPDNSSELLDRLDECASAYAAWSAAMRKQKMSEMIERLGAR